MLRSSASLTASAAKAELNLTLFLDMLTRALYARRLHGIHRCRKQAITLRIPVPGILSVMASRVENRRSGCNLPVAFDCAFASSPQSGLTWLCFLFPLVEPDRRISRIRLSEKTHDVPCDAVCNF